MYSFSYDSFHHRATIMNTEEKKGVALEMIGPKTAEFLRILIEMANKKCLKSQEK